MTHPLFLNEIRRTGLGLAAEPRSVGGQGDRAPGLVRT